MRRRYRGKHKKIMIFSIIGIFCFFSVGYAAFGSDFLISGKGTIISKPLPASEDLIKKVVTSGDGLYIDPIEDGRYVYRGTAPDNYIWLDLNGNKEKTDNEIFRIMAVEPDGTIKVVAQNTIGDIVWDPGYSNSISGITSSSSMEGTRYSSVSTDYCYYSTSTTTYHGCNIWGNKITMLDSNENNITSMPRNIGSTTLYNLPSAEAYINSYLNTEFYNSLNDTIKTKVVTHVFNVGILKDSSSQSLETDIEQEKAYKWKGKIGLINVTDYVKASLDSNCTSVYTGTQSTYPCKNDNYLFKSDYIKTITPRATSESNSHLVWTIDSSGSIRSQVNASNAFNTNPVFYLNYDIKLSGNGSEFEPYIPV